MDVEKGKRKENYRVERALYEAYFTLEDDRLSYQIETPLTTEFEKDGVNLSGGEAQKVAIARTLYRQQDIIIMDEPSSALDPLAEYRLNRELNEIAKDKTVVFISHRLSTVRDADCIYMMETDELWNPALTRNCWRRTESMRRCGEYRRGCIGTFAKLCL